MATQHEQILVDLKNSIASDKDAILRIIARLELATDELDPVKIADMGGWIEYYAKRVNTSAQLLAHQITSERRNNSKIP